jgi:hypothetical protein
MTADCQAVMLTYHIEIMYAYKLTLSMSSITSGKPASQKARNTTYKTVRLKTFWFESLKASYPSTADLECLKASRKVGNPARRISDILTGK